MSLAGHLDPDHDISVRAWDLDGETPVLLEHRGAGLARAGAVFLLRRFAGLWRFDSPVPQLARFAREAARVDETFVSAGPRVATELEVALEVAVAPERRFGVGVPRVVASIRTLDVVSLFTSLGSGATTNLPGMCLCEWFVTLVSETVSCEKPRAAWGLTLALEVRGLVEGEVAALHQFLHDIADALDGTAALTIAPEPSELVGWIERNESLAR